MASFDDFHNGVSKPVAAAMDDAVLAAAEAYTDSATTGLDFKNSCRLVTVAALAAYARVGNVITASVNGAMPTIDGVAPVVGNSICVKDGAADADNWIYTVTSLGSAGSKWSLTRRSDSNTSAKVTSGAYCEVEEGAQAGSGWYISTSNPITLNTTALVISQWSGKLNSTAATIAAVGVQAAGTSPQTARADHVHAHGTQAGGSLHADAIAAGDSGFLTGADKTKLDATSGTNTGDQASVSGSSGSCTGNAATATLATFSTACAYNAVAAGNSNQTPIYYAKCSVADNRLATTLSAAFATNYTIASGRLKIGSKLRIVVGGYITAVELATNKLTLTLSLGSLTLVVVVSPATTLAVADTFRIDVDVVVSSITTNYTVNAVGTVWFGRSGAGTLTSAVASLNQQNLTGTGTQLVSLLAAWDSTAGSGDANNARLDIFQVEIV